MSVGPFVPPIAPSPASPTVPPSTPPAPASPVQPTPLSDAKAVLGALRDWATPILLVALIATLLIIKFYPTPGPVVPGGADAVALGKSYAPILVRTYADSWDVAADQVGSGKSVSEAQKALQDAWKTSRVKAFNEKVKPTFAEVLAEGTEPTSAAHRATVAQLWHDFAKGLRKGAR